MTPTVDGNYIDPNQVGEGDLTAEQRLAKENILDHYRNPRNKRALRCAYRAREKNPLCGDELELMLAVEDGRVTDAAFQGRGCAISQASASMLTRAIVGKTVDDVKMMGQDDVLKMLGIPIGIVRRKCAMLALRTAQKALGGNQ